MVAVTEGQLEPTVVTRAFQLSFTWVAAADTEVASDFFRRSVARVLSDVWRSLSFSLVSLVIVGRKLLSACWSARILLRAAVFSAVERWALAGAERWPFSRAVKADTTEAQVVHIAAASTVVVVVLFLAGEEVHPAAVAASAKIATATRERRVRWRSGTRGCSAEVGLSIRAI